MNQSHSLFLDAADRIGRQLCRDAIWASNQCNWTGWSMEPVGRNWSPAYRAYGPELYAGTSGIALFLAQLYKFTAEPALHRTLCGAINQAGARVRSLPESVRAGFYSGTVGIAYSLYSVGRILNHEGLVRASIETLTHLKDIPLNAYMLDVVSGCAGSIGPLIRMGNETKTPALVEVANRFGQHLLNSAVKTDDGWSWDTMQIPGQLPLTGYSHGAAGIACAFLELHAVTGEPLYKEAAAEAFRYERRHFVPEQGNWKDLRNADGAGTPAQPICGMAWCHGAPGAGLARLRAMQLLGPDPALANEAHVAIQSTLSSLSRPVFPGAGNFSLCHGAGGNAELVIVAAQLQNRPDLFAAAQNVGVSGLEVFAKPGLPWPCGVANAGETPNLMLGTAGIGYFYLRLHNPSQVPSILLVDGGIPKRSSA